MVYDLILRLFLNRLWLQLLHITIISTTNIIIILMLIIPLLIQHRCLTIFMLQVHHLGLFFLVHVLSAFLNQYFQWFVLCYHPLFLSSFHQLLVYSVLHLEELPRAAVVVTWDDRPSGSKALVALKNYLDLWLSQRDVLAHTDLLDWVVVDLLCVPWKVLYPVLYLRVVSVWKVYLPILGHLQLWFQHYQQESILYFWKLWLCF